MSRSDIHFWKTGSIGSLVVEGDCILGHEAAGVVLQCGEGVTNLRPGADSQSDYDFDSNRVQEIEWQLSLVFLAGNVFSAWTGNITSAKKFSSQGCGHTTALFKDTKLIQRNGCTRKSAFM